MTTHQRTFVEIDSDSEDRKLSTSYKRQRTNSAQETRFMTPDSTSGLRQTRPPRSKNDPLKGRKRFKADLKDATELCAHGYEYKLLRAHDLGSGDDEGSIIVTISKDGEKIVCINLLVSETSDYPDRHTFYAYTPDANVALATKEIVEDIASEDSHPIVETIESVMRKLAKSMGLVAAGTASQPLEIDDDSDVDDGEADDEDVYTYDDDFGIVGTSATSSPLKLDRLQRDFIETVAQGYRPGFLSYGQDDFSITVSLPVVKLAIIIPPRALMAWDRRILARTQHLTLLIRGMRGVYPPLREDGKYSDDAHRLGASLRFDVGLTLRYKPSKERAREAGRNFGLVTSEQDESVPARLPDAPLYDDDEDVDPAAASDDKGVDVDDVNDEDVFDKFSLSSSLESLLDQDLVRLVHLRRKHGIGWAAAEALLSESERTQRPIDELFAQLAEQFVKADKAESKLGRTYELPADPLSVGEESSPQNLPLVAFSYLLRRLTLCTRFCVVCHNPIKTDFEALKPYVCEEKLCAYQYYSLNRGPSLEYEIRSNPATVDLLVSTAFVAAAEQVLDDPLPVGLGLMVPKPDSKRVFQPRRNNLVAMPGAPGTVAGNVPAAQLDAQSHINQLPEPESNGLYDFDKMNVYQMRASIASLIDKLPSIYDMKRHLEKKVAAGKAKPKLKDMDPTVLPASWLILRWCVASCTAYLEELQTPEDQIQNIGSGHKQFRFSVGAPDAEAKFQAAVKAAQAKNVNSMTYPSLYAFHGSPLKNWHSIIRHGLWFKDIAHGRAYGNGVYFGQHASTSMSGYAHGSSAVWRNSKVLPVSCTAVAEIVNLPDEFVSTQPHFVVAQTDWIMCRYLLVRSADVEEPEPAPAHDLVAAGLRTVPLDPKFPIFVNGTAMHNRNTSARKLEIPEPGAKIQNLLGQREREYMDEDYDEADQRVFEGPSQGQSQSQSQGQKEKGREVIEVFDSDEEEDTGGYDSDYNVAPRPGKQAAAPSAPVDDWVHDADYVQRSIEHLMPPPLESSPSATMAVQRELAALLKEQTAAKSLKELGWYLPQDFIGDNLFQWIVELHSFDPELPLAQDMKAKGLNSLIFEIRFPPGFPLSPPFFRIITPRFLPFIHGGGGHVTGGGSMCMDLLTSDGWLPSYSIAAILLQIKLAISNLDPRPARLATNYDQPYAVSEALAGFKRAAATHGWKVPDGLDRLAR